MLDKVLRLNVVLVDIDTFTESDFDIYKSVLDELALKLKGMYLEGMAPQLNLLTDRMMLDKMNNCNAGVEILHWLLMVNSIFVLHFIWLTTGIPSAAWLKFWI